MQPCGPPTASHSGREDDETASDQLYRRVDERHQRRSKRPAGKKKLKIMLKSVENEPGIQKEACMVEDRDVTKAHQLIHMNQPGLPVLHLNITNNRQI